jgi:hypothetical protein
MYLKVWDSGSPKVPYLALISNNLDVEICANSLQLDFYTRFKDAHADLVVCFAKFRRLRPFFVKRLKDFNSCCCKYHQEMAEIVIGFNNMRAHSVHLEGGEGPCTWGCDFVCCKPIEGNVASRVVTCQAAFHTYKHSSELWEKLLCLRSLGSEWHSIRCLRGQCSDCGLHRLPICDKELDPGNNSSVEWRRFEKVNAGKTKSGESKIVLRLEFKSTKPRAFLAWATPKIKQFVLHQFIAKWQDSQYKLCAANLRVGEVMSLINFAENYSFKGQNEIQSQHWTNVQLTILVHITYTVNPEYNPEDPKSRRLKTQYFYYVSDDRLQDSLFAGLSYRASGGLLAGVPGGQAGGLVHYALYEPGGVL